MSRKDEFKTTSKNPSTKFIEWKSDLKCFSYYDRDEKENISIELPFKFLTLMEFATVKGWNDKSQSAIYSNEVKFIGTEEIEVKSFKGGLITKGLYKDVKEQIKNAGGHYSKSIYAMLEDGSIVNIQLKGSGVQKWSEFTQKSRSRLADEWINVYDAEDLKKGRIDYSVPLFKYDGSLGDESDKLADGAYDELKEYIEGYLKKEVVEDAPVVSDDDLDPPF